ncbi:carbon storage regulator [Neobacillus ginsengisoli]|uniref:Carbon storage regulator CsrA n=1 Tax=Neobacillus ginsengisoli TaxID=904295 RepID=A0ABT9XXG0_9BACI|nr:carbon storage regulator [Neobacillus ginsengisoli]MDQ0199572.1 carbon storage regulator CsrA [Neobacillus ginsengisoli]
MLIVGREIGQSVIIGEEIKVTVLQVGSKPRLVIDSPMNTKIKRVKQSQNEIGNLKNGARKVGTTMLIGDVIKVSILQTESGLLRFAIDAPKEINVFREEIYQNKKRGLNQIENQNFMAFDCNNQNIISVIQM